MKLQNVIHILIGIVCFGLSPGAKAVVPGSPDVARALVADFNFDNHPDFVLQNASTHQTAIWYVRNNVHIGGTFGPTLPAGWELKGVDYFNYGLYPDYALYAPNSRRTAIWYLTDNSPFSPDVIFSHGENGPTLPIGWELVAVAHLNGGWPQYILYKPASRQTAVWYLTNDYVDNIFRLYYREYGPILPAGFGVVAQVAGFDGYQHSLQLVLFNPNTGQTSTADLNGEPAPIYYGPTVPHGWALVAAADFNGDWYPDFLLYNASTRQTYIWYLRERNHRLYFVRGAHGPRLPPGWSLVAP
jgi:hypothetical protein